MKYNRLGKTDIKVSEICLGTMTWGEQNTEAEGHEQMDYALDNGVNFFDTAELYAIPPREETYGRTEEIIGTWFNKTGNRDKVILATKVAGSGVEWIRGGNLLTGKSVDAAVEDSLKRLQTDYIDLYQLHWPNRQFPHFGRHYASTIDFKQDDTTAILDNFLDVLKALDDHVKAGRIRYVGLSNESPWGTMKYLELAKEHNLPRMQSIQNEYSVLRRVDDPLLAEVCVRENVSYLPWSPLGGGMLSGKYLDGARPKGARWSLGDRYNSRDTEQAQNAVRKYMDIARRHNLDVCQMVLAYVNSRSFVTSNIIGATSIDQLKTNIYSAEITLTSEIIAEMDSVYRSAPIPF